MNTEVEPLFSQVATFVEDLILDGSLNPGDRAPSTNELATFHEINPATARKGIAMLVDANFLETRRGIGTFVTDGAREAILMERRHHFAAHFVAPLIDEALRLGYTRDSLNGLMSRVAESRGMYG
ncbi:GntR family transcriptional regulator [Corynebacterium sp. LK2510]|uniref:GntR family transcriptional regulator n=1 Tax=Corynebacterium sp. LK2510 TaxID=3110472 RepID=UPI0034CF98B7